MSVFESFMTGQRAGQQDADRRTRQQTGSLMASGDYEGAARTAYQGGDLATGQAVTGIGQQAQAQARWEQIAPLVREGDFDGAMAIAHTPEEFTQLRGWKAKASEEEKALAADKAAAMARIGAALAGMPPEQRLAEAQRLAPTFGMDPAQITPEMLDDNALKGWTIQSLGLEGWLKLQDTNADNERMDRTQAERERANQAREGVQGAREARMNRPKPGGGQRSRRAPAGSRGSPAVPSGGKPWDRYR